MTKTFTKKNRAKRKINKEKLEEAKRPKLQNDSEEEEINDTQDDWKPIEKMPSDLQGFDSDDDESKMARDLIQQHNKKKKKSGGFQSMGISFPVFNAITKKGYKVPTPIQRKTIPMIMDGRDVVAMARTGSGKTAAFLIPMFERLKTHAPTGIRALIMSPTRELALQTLKFTKELGKFTKLKFAIILGGDRMEDQFASIHENPDVLIATPGRFMHVVVEMNMKLSNVEYIVFDEADRLFEMGFQEHLVETMKRLPESRQTLLFSATLPRLLVDFARAGLSDPTLIRLDVDTKLSENLQLTFLQVRNEDKLALLLHLLDTSVTRKQQTVLFVATKHHVEYLRMILEKNKITCSYSYSSLDQTARKINVAKFRQNSTSVLIVTDLAARGIDIPLLDNVINFNFPAKPKLFQHRVGRVARAGRTGSAISLVAPEEIPYVIDLHLFLGRPPKFSMLNKQYDSDSNGYCGRVPMHLLDDYDEKIRNWHRDDDLAGQKKVAFNAYKNYVRSRPVASSESIKRYKEICVLELGYHPMFNNVDQGTSTTTNSGQLSLQDDSARMTLLDTMKLYRPPSTIFEINSTSKTSSGEMMKRKRLRDTAIIQLAGQKMQLVRNKNEYDGDNSDKLATAGEQCAQQEDEDEIRQVFTTIVAPKPAQTYQEKQAAKNAENDVYINYKPKDFESEKGLSLGNSFEKDVAGQSFDLVNDDGTKKLQNQMKWDRKKKKFVNESGKEGNKKRILTESGTWIKASYKSNLYKEWLDKNKVVEFDDPEDRPMKAIDYRKRGKSKRGRGGRGGGGMNRADHASREEGGHHDRSHSRDSSRGRGQSRGQSSSRGRGGSTRGGRGSSRVKSELRSRDEILKIRKTKDKVQNFQKHQKEQRQKRKAIRGKRK